MYQEAKDQAEAAILAKAATKPWVLIGACTLAGFLLGLFVGGML